MPACYRAVARAVGALAALLCFSISDAGEPPNAPAANGENDTGPCLARLNYYRELTGLNRVVEDPSLSAGDQNHARYLIKRVESDASAVLETHGENPALPWATPSGAKAAEHSTVAIRADADDHASLASQAAHVIDDWMAEPFQRLHLLDPTLRQIGLGLYREAPQTAVVMQVSPNDSDTNEVQSKAQYMSEGQFGVRAAKYPIMFPPPNSEIPLCTYEGGEWPEPLAAFPDYRLPSGLPISLELGPDSNSATVSAHELIANGRELENHVFDAETYSGASPGQTAAGRADLATFGAIVVIPKLQLSPGTKYQVSITANGKQYVWSFSTHAAQ